jgi:hypothetical protein
MPSTVSPYINEDAKNSARRGSSVASTPGTISQVGPGGLYAPELPTVPRDGTIPSRTNVSASR